MIRELISANRSYRRFDQSHEITTETLQDLVSLARFSASGANKQPLKYLLSSSAATNDRIFPYLAWAGYLKDWSGPAEGERPSAYIIILLDTAVSKNAGVDHGIAAQSILLGAAELGLGGCMIGALQREGLRQELEIDPRYEVLLAVALGKPVEQVVLEDAPEGGSIEYYRDAEGVHHVPKRTLQELILEL